MDAPFDHHVIGSDPQVRAGNWTSPTPKTTAPAKARMQDGPVSKGTCEAVPVDVTDARDATAGSDEQAPPPTTIEAKLNGDSSELASFSSSQRSARTDD